MSANLNLQSIAVFLSGAAAAILSSAPAMAAEERPVIVYAEPQEVRTERVPLTSLDLASLGGQKRLHHKVGAAVERVCQLDLGRDGLQDRGYYSCASSAWGAASAQIADAVAGAREAALAGKPSVAATAIVVSGR